jgi:gluconolactonase
VVREMRKIAGDVGRCTGPVIRSNGEIVVASMDHGRLYSLRAGATNVLAELGHLPNGATEWSDGTLYVAQAGGMRSGPDAGTGGIQVVSAGGTWRWLTQDPVSPNDLCFGPDGLLYITDPTRQEPRIDARLFRCDITSGECELLCTLPWYSNSIGFGLDDALYVGQCEPAFSIVRFPLEGGRLGRGEPFIVLPPGFRTHGFAFDTEGNITIGANAEDRQNGDMGALFTYDRNGTLIDTLYGKSKTYPNIALGRDRVLIVCDANGNAVHEIRDWPYAGLPLYPFRKPADLDLERT